MSQVWSLNSWSCRRKAEETNTDRDLSEGIQHTMTCFCCCLHTSPTVSWLQFINICKDNMLTQSWQQSGLDSEWCSSLMSSARLSHHDEKAVMSLAGSIVTLCPSLLLIHISTVETFSYFTNKLLLWKTKSITSLLWFVSVCGHVGSFLMSTVILWKCISCHADE